MLGILDEIMTIIILSIARYAVGTQYYSSPSLSPLLQPEDQQAVESLRQVMQKGLDLCISLPVIKCHPPSRAEGAEEPGEEHLLVSLQPVVFPLSPSLRQIPI